MTKTNAARSFSNCVITEARLEILRFLAEWRFATTSQLNQELQAGKSTRHTSGDLAALRQGGMVTGYEIVTSLGNRSQLCWLITRRGADTINVSWNSKYSRRPSRDRLMLRSMELELIRTVRFANGDFKLIQPVTYSPARPLIKPTAQAQKLAATIERLEAARIKTAIEQGHLNPRGQSVLDFESKTHLWSLPQDCNEYLTYDQSNPDRIAIVILCPPSAAERFWLSKLESYARLVSKHWIQVWGCFYSEQDRLAGERTILAIENNELIKKWSKPLLTARKALPAPAATGPVIVKTVVINQLYELFEELENSNQQ